MKRFLPSSRRGAITDKLLYQAIEVSILVVLLGVSFYAIFKMTGLAGGPSTDVEEAQFAALVAEVQTLLDSPLPYEQKIYHGFDGGGWVLGIDYFHHKRIELMYVGTTSSSLSSSISRQDLTNDVRLYINRPESCSSGSCICLYSGEGGLTTSASLSDYILTLKEDKIGLFSDVVDVGENHKVFELPDASDYLLSCFPFANETMFAQYPKTYSYVEVDDSTVDDFGFVNFNLPQELHELFWIPESSLHSLLLAPSSRNGNGILIEKFSVRGKNIIALSPVDSLPFDVAEHKNIYHQHYNLQYAVIASLYKNKRTDLFEKLAKEYLSSSNYVPSYSEVARDLSFYYIENKRYGEAFSVIAAALNTTFSRTEREMMMLPLEQLFVQTTPDGYFTLPVEKEELRTFLFNLNTLLTEEQSTLYIQNQRTILMFMKSVLLSLDAMDAGVSSNLLEAYLDSIQFALEHTVIDLTQASQEYLFVYELFKENEDSYARTLLSNAFLKDTILLWSWPNPDHSFFSSSENQQLIDAFAKEWKRSSFVNSESSLGKLCASSLGEELRKACPDCDPPICPEPEQPETE